MLNENLWSQLAHCSFTKHGRHTRTAAGFKMSALSLHLSEHFNNSLFMQYKKKKTLSSFPYFPFSLLLPCPFSPWVSETLPEAKYWTLICVGRNLLPHLTSWAWENSAASWDDATARGIFQKCGSIWSVTWSFVKMSAWAQGHSFRSLGTSLNVLWSADFQHWG